jgi:putative ABC transport system permease protein
MNRIPAMDIRPILSTLMRHKIASLLIVLEIALTCAIVCNALFLIGDRLDRMNMPSGIADDELVRIQAASLRQLSNDEAVDKSVSLEYLDTLRRVPGVREAAIAGQVPFGGSSNNSSVNLTPDQERPTLNATVYMDEGNLVDTFGLKLVAGRDFNSDEFQDISELQKAGDKAQIPVAIINRTMAEKLYPGQNAVGKVFYSWTTAPTRVVGVVEELARPNSLDQGAYAMIFPLREYGAGKHYLLRTEPARRAEVLQAALAALKKTDPNLLVAWMLVVVIVALLLVTALGIVGLASFWVQQRTKQIGVRRALGATRGQILRYFQLENFLLATVGIAIGMLLAYSINQLLMAKYELPRLPLHYLPLGALALWLLGQAAVYGPARRAASVPPAVATRSV